MTAVTPKESSEQNQSFGFLTPVTYKTLLLVLFSLLPLEFCFLTNTWFVREDRHVIGIQVLIYLFRFFSIPFVGRKAGEDE